LPCLKPTHFVEVEVSVEVVEAGEAVTVAAAV
jgi:hypothetical protein